MYAYQRASYPSSFHPSTNRRIYRLLSNGLIGAPCGVHGRFVLGWRKLGYEERWTAYIVNYADDLVICCRTGAEQALATMQKMSSPRAILKTR